MRILFLKTGEISSFLKKAMQKAEKTASEKTAEYLDEIREIERLANEED